jgi:hypothetical protein
MRLFSSLHPQLSVYTSSPRSKSLSNSLPEELTGPWGGAYVRRCVALCLIGADVQHPGEADLFPGKGGELRASLWQEASSIGVR